MIWVLLLSLCFAMMRNITCFLSRLLPGSSGSFTRLPRVQQFFWVLVQKAFLFWWSCIAWARLVACCHTDRCHVVFDAVCLVTGWPLSWKSCEKKFFSIFRGHGKSLKTDLVGAWKFWNLVWCTWKRLNFKRVSNPHYLKNGTVFGEQYTIQCCMTEIINTKFVLLLWLLYVMSRKLSRVLKTMVEQVWKKVVRVVDSPWIFFPKEIGHHTGTNCVCVYDGLQYQDPSQMMLMTIKTTRRNLAKRLRKSHRQKKPHLSN